MCFLSIIFASYLVLTFLKFSNMLLPKSPKTYNIYAFIPEYTHIIDSYNHGKADLAGTLTTVNDANT